MAHADYGQLRNLVSLLDYENIDIYIHINKRSHNWDKNVLNNAAIRSKIFFVDRVNIYYCDYSQVNAQKKLLEAATKNGYDYYHLISGSDLPLHPISEIIRFFDMNKGWEFVGIAKNYDSRLAGIKAFFSNTIRTSSGVKQRIAIRLSKLFKNAQLFLGINLSKAYDGKPYKGSDWWSISHEAAIYVLGKEPEFKKYFIHCYCPSELFIQTILGNSAYKEKFFHQGNERISSLREIDWHRGNPYVWRKTDYEQLIKSPCMFARKFNPQIDMEIINLISKHVKQ